MKITVLGAGNIGRTLGKKWLQAGHEIIFGVRDPNSPKTLAALEDIGPLARTADIDSALDFGEIILFSVPWAAVAEIAAQFAGKLNGKILIDATNNFAGPVYSNLEGLQKAAPQASVFRAFNTMGWEIFASPILDGQQVDLFFCGPASAKVQVEGLAQAVGVRPVWVGENDRAAIVDHLGLLWVTLAFQRGLGRNLALKMLGK